MTSSYASKSSSRLRVWVISVFIAAILLAPILANAQETAMVGPLRLTASPYGLVIGDYVGRQVLILDPETLAITDSFRVYTDETQLEYGKPLSVGWMNGRLYVGEEHTGLIQVWEYSNGKNNPKSKGKSKNAGWVQVSASLTPSPLVHPSAIVADEAAGLLFVASKGEQSVLVLNESGTEVRRIGGAASAAPLGNPQAIALDPVGQRVFVSDDGLENCGMMGCSLSSVVQVYDYDGGLLGTINGSTGNAGYKFSRAQGVALDAAGRVFLADSYRHEIMVFEEPVANTWSAIGLLGGKGSGPGQLLLPTGVLVEPETSGILVANTMLSRVEVFDMEDLTP